MVRQHHRFNGHEFEQTPGDSGGQRSLVFCSPRGCKDLDATYWLNNNKQEKYPSKLKKKNFIAFNRSYML